MHVVQNLFHFDKKTNLLNLMYSCWIAKKCSLNFQLQLTSFPIKIRESHIWSLTIFLYNTDLT